MFGLTPADLGGTILDCPGGAAAFAADMRPAGRIVAVDPAYRLPRAELVRVIQADVERANRFVVDHQEGFSWRFFRSAADHRQARADAAGRFLGDVLDHPERYVAGALPALPFRDRSFDLVLSGHLLFTYADRLDESFHVAAADELVRVSRREVRIFPVVGLESRPYDNLDGLRRRLRSIDVATELRRVDYEFQRGGNEMLACWRAG